MNFFSTIQRRPPVRKVRTEPRRTAREEFEEYRAFVMLTLRVAERTVLAETIQPPFPEHPVEVQDPKGEV